MCYIVRIQWIGQQCAISGYFWHGGCVAGNDRRSTSHRFQHGNSETFAERRVKKGKSTVIERCKVSVGDVAGKG